MRLGSSFDRSGGFLEERYLSLHIQVPRKGHVTKQQEGDSIHKLQSEVWPETKQAATLIFAFSAFRTVRK